MTVLDRAFAAGLAVGLIFLVAIGAVGLPPLASRGDFAEQWSAARLILEGGQPYDSGTWQASAARLAGRASDSPVFIYPPYVALALVPVAAIPLAAAATLWVTAGVLLAAFAIRWLLRSYPPPHPAIAAFIGLTLAASGPSLLALAQGQWGFFHIASAVAAAAAQRRGRAATTAVSLVPFFLKPQLAPFVVLAFARAQAGARRWRYLAVVGVAALVILATIVVVPTWWVDWYRGIVAFTATHPLRTTTLATTFEALFGAAGALAAAAAVIVAVAIALVFEPRSDVALAVWLATAVLVAPYIQAYDHVLLLVPLVIAVGVAARRSQRTAFAIAAIGVPVLLIAATASDALTIARGHDVVGALVPAVMWLLVVVGLWPDRRLTASRGATVAPESGDQ